MSQGSSQSRLYSANIRLFALSVELDRSHAAGPGTPSRSLAHLHARALRHMPNPHLEAGRDLQFERL